MFQIGPSLREARTRRGLSPADVHKAIRIRERYLTALEEERWDMLPGDAYTKGFLRTYAEFLGLHGQLYIDEFNARIAVKDEEPLVPESLQGSRGRVSNILFRSVGAVILVGAAIAGLVAWQHNGSQRPHVQEAQAAPPAAHVTLKPATEPAAKPAVTPAPKPTYTVIRATRDHSWLSVRLGGPNGRELYRGTLEVGRHLKYGLDRSIWVRMGRPLALDIRIGDTAVSGLPNAPSNVLLTKTGARR
jgi:cytoskeletal protein RodZ